MVDETKKQFHISDLIGYLEGIVKENGDLPVVQITYYYFGPFAKDDDIESLNLGEFLRVEEIDEETLLVHWVGQDLSDEC